MTKLVAKPVQYGLKSSRDFGMTVYSELKNSPYSSVARHG
jgi:hypothetical protein